MYMSQGAVTDTVHFGVGTENCLLSDSANIMKVWVKLENRGKYRNI